MSATTAVAENAAMRLGVMVRTNTELFVYWQPGRHPASLLRVSDLTGRPPEESLDGRGRRDVVLSQQVSLYLKDLLPGHMYFVELGDERDGAFQPVIGAGPVQTPWLPTTDASTFPAPYHRS